VQIPIHMCELMSLHQFVIYSLYVLHLFVIRLFDAELSSLRHLLRSSCDEMISGNAALCLAHCFELDGVATRLLGTDIVLLLLRHAAGEAERTAVRQNAAIALGKLCRSEPRYPLTLLYRLQIVNYILEMGLEHY